METIKERNERIANEESTQKLIRKNYVKQKRGTITDIRHHGYLAVTYMLEALKANEKLKPDNGLTYSETITAVQEGLDHYLNKQKNG